MKKNRKLEDRENKKKSRKPEGNKGIERTTGQREWKTPWKRKKWYKKLRRKENGLA